MKRISTFLGFLFFISMMTISGEIKSMDPKASIEFEASSIDLGEIEFGKAVKTEFIFKNPGMLPLVITKVESSCGCTVADYPKQPILSGAQGKIVVTYDAETEGYFSKTITVFANSEEGLHQLHIEGVVVK